MSKTVSNFEENYWHKNYSEPETMDGVMNASTHANYAKCLFDLEGVRILSIMDIGFGLGALLQEFGKTFKPKSLQGIDPSRLVYEKALERKVVWEKKTGCEIRLRHCDFKTWVLSSKREKPFDLGIFSSVLQYLPSEGLEKQIKDLSRKVKYLYLTVPTDKELRYQREELDFHDEYAVARSRTFYLKLLGAHFTFVSSRLLESKYYFDCDSTPFQELLFRF